MLCYLNVNRPKTINKSVKFRAFRNIPVPDYRNDVKVLMCNRRKPQKNIDDLINNYNSTLQKLTDKYAPFQCKNIPLLPHAPWYTSASPMLIPVQPLHTENYFTLQKLT